MSQTIQVSFLGTGIMGAPMARHIAAAGFPLRVWNRSHDKATPLEADGASVLAGPGAAVQGADIIIFMVTSGQVADDLLFGAPGLGKKIKPGAIVVMMSSIAVDIARKQAEKLAEMGIGYVDAPVSGGEKGAIAGSLAIMAGGADAHVSTVEPVLRTMGRVTHVGPVGTGQLAKLANQIIVAGSLAVIAEALTLAAQGGADPKQVRQALSGGFADSVILQQQGLRMIEGRFEPGGSAFNQVKDLDAVASISQELGLSLPVTARITELFRQMVAEGDGALDHSGVIRQIQRKNGLL